jgi:CRP-like cAMP-binding protein
VIARHFDMEGVQLNSFDLFYSARVYKLKYKESLYQEGDESNIIYFIEEGQINLVKMIRLAIKEHMARYKKVPIAKIMDNNVFGL